eukprot:COSAG05_NODE_21206_length_273_cov_1.775862_1_plen_57_part_01
MPSGGPAEDPAFSSLVCPCRSVKASGGAPGTCPVDKGPDLITGVNRCWGEPAIDQEG